ncbi:MAG: hypothetical protein P8Y29_12330, partial [Gemmatimonadota bacterium]
WLYEGVTEWGAHAMQLRSGLKTIEEHLAVIAGKIRSDRQFRADYSLEQLALTSYTEEGQRQYSNIYQRGALVGELLDILLLDLSDGESGLQDLLQKLMRYYGKGRAFPDCGFYDVVAAMTYPEVFQFFERYVKHAEPLPIGEYYGKLHVSFEELKNLRICHRRHNVVEPAIGKCPTLTGDPLVQIAGVPTAERSEPKRGLLIAPEFPASFWSYRHIMPMVGRKAAFPPLGLITFAAMMPDNWSFELIDLNVERMPDGELRERIDAADAVFTSAMSVQKPSLVELVDGPSKGLVGDRFWNEEHRSTVRVTATFGVVQDAVDRLDPLTSLPPNQYVETAVQDLVGWSPRIEQIIPKAR